MEANLIILSKAIEDKQLDIGLKDHVKKALSNIYTDVTDNMFKVQPRNDEFDIRYKMSSKSSDMLFLKLSCDNSPSKAAEAISYAVLLLKNGSHRKDWNIVVSYDESSHYYCCKLMNGFGKFERKTRNLIYITLIKAFGNKWVENSISIHQELYKELKSKGLKTSDLIEGALNELTYEELKHFLFDPYPDLNVFEVLNNQLRRENIADLEKNQIIEIINKCRVENSLWDRFFIRYKEFADFKEILNSLQKPRNSVMHHKQITRNQFEEYRKTLRDINKKLDRATDILEDEIFSQTTMTDVFGALGQIASALVAASKRVTASLKPAMELFSKIALSSATTSINVSSIVSNLSLLTAASSSAIDYDGLQENYVKLANYSNIISEKLPKTSYIPEYSTAINAAKLQIPQIQIHQEYNKKVNSEDIDKNESDNKLI